MAEIKENLKKFWNWLWNSESIWSYIVFLVLLFIVVKFIFLPGLGLVFGTSLPLAIVESSSMDHHSLKYCLNYDSRGNCVRESSDYILCDKTFSSNEFKNFNEYWGACGQWYEKNTNITQEQFSSFKFKNGFSKGDIIIIFGKKTSDIKIGDIIIFQSAQPTPIIHRVISLNPLQTKGDHNPKQLIANNNLYNVDETNIKDSHAIGVAVARIPYMGWVKLGLVELIKKIF
jgi:hypothetical protein